MKFCEWLHGFSFALLPCFQHNIPKSDTVQDNIGYFGAFVLSFMSHSRVCIGTRVCYVCVMNRHVSAEYSDTV